MSFDTTSLWTWYTGLAFILFNCGYCIYLNRRRNKMIRFAVRAWRQRNQARERMQDYKVDAAVAYATSDLRALEEAVSLRKRWDSFAIQEALYKARAALEEQTPCDEEKETLDKILRARRPLRERYEANKFTGIDGTLYDIPTKASVIRISTHSSSGMAYTVVVFTKDIDHIHTLVVRETYEQVQEALK